MNDFIDNKSVFGDDPQDIERAAAFFSTAVQDIWRNLREYEHFIGVCDNRRGMHRDCDGPIMPAPDKWPKE